MAIKTAHLGLSCVLLAALMQIKDYAFKVKMNRYLNR